MNAEIVTSGTEILLGEIVDTNAPYIARQLRSIGVNVFFKTTVGDNEQRIADVLAHALSRCDLVIVTGGLGPTVDDVTREAVAKVTGRELVLYPELLAQIETFFTRLGRKMSPNNSQQAMLPAGSIPLENPVGTAPSFIVEDELGTIICLPGVPREMEYQITQRVIPYLRQRLGGQGIIKAKVLRTVGIGESHIDELIPDLMRLSNPTVGLAAKSAQADIRLTAKADSEAEADRMIAELEAEVRKRLGTYIYGEDKQTVEEVVVAELAKRGLRLALIESNTGGNIASRLRTTPTESTVLVRSEVIGRDFAMPGVDLAQALALPSEDAEKVVADTARQWQQTTGADIALVLLGSSGAGEGMYSERTGRTLLGLALQARVLGRTMALGGTNDLTVRWIGNNALALLWRMLQGSAESN